MAGLVGYIGKRIEDEDPNLINSMISAINYVETDIVDEWSDSCLTIARVHHGVVNPEKQPIFNEDKSLLIFMDGEVYDYEDEKQLLLKKGHRFKYEQNDAEFCLHLYEELGEESFIKLNGSFLLVIYDLRTRELILVNDRFSSCPLFYHTANGHLIFGPQLKAIIQSEKVPRKLDSQAIIEFFTFQRVLGTRTYYEDIEVLFPASILRYKQGRISFKKYWEINYREDQSKTKEYYIEAFTDSLTRSVKRRTSDKFRYAILLSGGMDSRAILAAADCPMTAFTLGDFENREVKTAKQIADAKGCKHVFLQRHFDYYPDIIERAVELGDGMFTFQHAHFTGFLEPIQKESDILLHGYGFDIFYKGKYLPKKKVNILGKHITFPILKKISEENLLDSIISMSGISTWDEKPEVLFAERFRAEYRDTLERSIKSIISKGLGCAKKYYNLFDYLETHFLYKNYGFLNKLCIKHFMDERTICIDNDLLRMHLEIPYQLRFNGIIYKKALERLNPEIAEIPYSNTGLPPTIPVWQEWGMTMAQKAIEKIKRPKLPHPAFTQGSWPEMGELIRHNEKLKQLIWSVINDEKCINLDIFNRSALVEMFNKHIMRQGDFTFFLILILTFGVWYRKYGPG